MKKLIILILILIAANSYLFYVRYKNSNSSELLSVNYSTASLVNLNYSNINQPTTPAQEEVKEESNKVGEQTEIKDKVYLDVPFSSQAPDANWDQPYQDACEEIAVIMVNAFWQGEKLTRESANKKILDIVDFQNKTYGDYKDTNAEETAQLIRDYYGYKKVEVKYDITIDDIKRELSAGRPVIVPAYGRGLGNPNYTSPGPVYHNLVVKGYDASNIITNDGGTRNGLDYKYSYDVFYNAIHDWNEGDVDNGRKAMIVVNP